MTIKITDILKLRPLKHSDAESIAKHANNINVWRNLTDMFPHPYTIDDALFFINKQKDTNPPSVYGIVFNDEVIGTIGLSVSKENKKLCGDIGYWIGEKFWNQGIITSSIKAIIKYGFKKFEQIDCMSASVFINNIASIKALEKADMIQEKLIKKAIPKAGEKKDIYFYRISRKRYNELRSI